MNERIRELYEQAMEQHVSNNAAWEELNPEKFAELIVRECVAICEDTEGDPSADSRWGRRCCALEIREHFGVDQ
jgi:hypothetical protein